MKKNVFYFKTALFSLLILLNSANMAQSHDTGHKAEPKTADRWTQRLKWQLPVKIMKEIGVKEGMTIADIGAAEGYFTFYLAGKVGNTGKVYASDIDESALKTINERCKNENVNNVTVILGKGDDPLIPNGCLDIAIIINVVQALKDAPSYLKNIAKSLKIDGQLVIIEWASEKYDSELQDWENPEEHSLRYNLRQIYDGNFEVVKLLTFLPMQNIYVCKPKLR